MASSNATSSVAGARQELICRPGRVSETICYLQGRFTGKSPAVVEDAVRCSGRCQNIQRSGLSQDG